MPDSVFAIDFTHEGLTASFVFPDGTEQDTAGFDLTDFHAGEAKALDKLVTLLIAKAKASGHNLTAVALALPCDLDVGRERIVSFPQAAWLNNQALPGMLQDALGVPVVMERRSVISLCYDRIMSGLPEDCLTIGCYVDTHYDSAIWHRGSPLLGRNGRAGNIAHMPIQEREDTCFCGKAGCVDLYGAGVRVRQMHNMIFPDLPVEELFERHGEHPLIRDYVAMMAYPIAMEANVLDPEFIILGGSIPAMRGFPRSILEQEILRQSYRPAGANDVAFLSSVASMTPGVVCAAQYALMQLNLV